MYHRPWQQQTAIVGATFLRLNITSARTPVRPLHEGDVVSDKVAAGGKMQENAIAAE